MNQLGHPMLAHANRNSKLKRNHCLGMGPLRMVLVHITHDPTQQALCVERAVL